MENVIKFIIRWIIEDQLSIYVAGTWLFALLACIEVPLCVKMIQQLRKLVRESRRLRQNIVSDIW